MVQSHEHTHPARRSPRRSSRRAATSCAPRMAREGIDLFIAYSDDRAAFGQQHARYLFNYQPHFEPALTIIPVDGEALIATGPESDQFVLRDLLLPKGPRGGRVRPCRRGVPALGDLTRWPTCSGRWPAAGAWRWRASMPCRSGPGRRCATPPRPRSSMAMPCSCVSAPSRARPRSRSSGMPIASPRPARGRRSGPSRRGSSEREVAAEAEFAMRRLGSEGMGIDTIVAAGSERTRAILARTTTAADPGRRPRAADPRAALRGLSRRDRPRGRGGSDPPRDRSGGRGRDPGPGRGRRRP